MSGPGPKEAGKRPGAPVLFLGLCFLPNNKKEMNRNHELTAGISRLWLCSDLGEESMLRGTEPGGANRTLPLSGSPEREGHF